MIKDEPSRKAIDAALETALMRLEQLKQMQQEAQKESYNVSDDPRSLLPSD